MKSESLGPVEPKYIQLYEALRTRILTGAVMPGARILSKREAASFYDVSVNTADAAYQQLVSEGYLEARPRSGFFVCDIGASPVRPTVVEEAAPASDWTYEEDTSVDASFDDQIDFSPNGTDLSVFPLARFRKAVRECLEKPAENLFSVCDPMGDPALRLVLSRYLFEARGIKCSPNQILIGAGTDFILQLLIRIIRAACQIDAIAMENPVYNKAYQIFTGIGLPVRPVPVDSSGIRPAELAASGADLVYLTPSHQFPLGFTLPISRRAEILAWSRESPNRFVIEDDYDSEFRYAGRPIPSIRSMDTEDRVIYLGTFSKSLSPSVRVSYLVLPERLRDVFTKKLSYYATTVTRYEQQILAHFIQSGDFERHIARMRTLCRRKRDLLLDSLAPYKSRLAISGTQAGHHLIVRVRGDMREEDLVASAKNAAVQVYGISSYFVEEMSRAGYRPPQGTVLLGYAGLSEREITEGAKRLADAWNLG